MYNGTKRSDNTDEFVCVKDYVSQKGLSKNGREENVKNAFKCTGDMQEKSLILIDDVITTGATIQECVRELRKNGAEKIYVIVLAVNQRQTSYWSSREIYARCPNCGKKMQLLVNSTNKKFFYRCHEDGGTVNYEDARRVMCHDINVELEKENDF